MRKRNGWLVVLLAAGLALTPAVVRAQGGELPEADPILPLPLGHKGMDDGGLFFGLEALFWRQTNPLHDQPIAIRGVRDVDGSIAGGTPGQFIGSGAKALSARDVGPGTYALGFRVTGGYLFRNGIEAEINWIHLFDTKYGASAGPLPFGGRSGTLLEETFLTAPVFNFPPDFAGPAQKVNLGNPGATFGIWDAATTMQIEFIQRFDQVELSARIPLLGDDCSRTYWLIGPRAGWLWERFKWRTVATDVNTGQAGQDDVAIYSNIVSQRFYGAHLGAGWEWGGKTTPVGAFALSIEVQGALFADVVKERAKYERGDFAIAAQRAKTDYTLVPELQARINLWWYPIEAVQLRVGYDVMAFFNTYSSPDPVSFNVGALDPPFRSGTLRIFDGVSVGVAFIF